jgi:hypothetical protein
MTAIPEGLSDRLRPDIECAPWVIAEVKKLEAALAASQQEVERLTALRRQLRASRKRYKLDNAGLVLRLIERDEQIAALAKDAARWRALIGSARVRVLGSAGLISELNPYDKPWDGYAHIGLELWTRHEAAANEPPDAAEWITKYADIAIDAAIAEQANG